LTKRGLKTQRQKIVSVYYDDVIIGDFYTDIIVEELVICELKSKEAIVEADEKQLINYQNQPVSRSAFY
jgi:GxxExxY protein